MPLLHRSSARIIAHRIEVSWCHTRGRDLLLLTYMIDHSSSDGYCCSLHVPHGQLRE